MQTEQNEKDRIETCIKHLESRPDLKEFIKESGGFLWTSDTRIYELDDLFGIKGDSPTSFCLLLSTLQDIFIAADAAAAEKEEEEKKVVATVFELRNLCIECGVDMGDCNPRQYCGKWKCDNNYN